MYKSMASRADTINEVSKFLFKCITKGYDASFAVLQYGNGEDDNLYCQFCITADGQGRKEFNGIQAEVIGLGYSGTTKPKVIERFEQLLKWRYERKGELGNAEKILGFTNKHKERFKYIAKHGFDGWQQLEEGGNATQFYNFPRNVEELSEWIEYSMLILSLVYKLNWDAEWSVISEADPMNSYI